MWWGRGLWVLGNPRSERSGSNSDQTARWHGQDRLRERSARLSIAGLRRICEDELAAVVKQHHMGAGTLPEAELWWRREGLLGPL